MLEAPAEGLGNNLSKQEAPVGAILACIAPGCEARPHARGWCLTHYTRWKRTGDPLGGGPIRRQPRSRTLAERFWSKVDQRGPDECWTWAAARTPDGYGRFLVGGRAGTMRPAHRVALWLHSGVEPPAGLVVRHACNNPPCCNPAHLLTGTHADNSDDMVRAARQSRGVARPASKLTEADVRAIRDLIHQGAFKSDVAARFGVTDTVIRRIVRGEAWRHVTAEQEA